MRSALSASSFIRRSVLFGVFFSFLVAAPVALAQPTELSGRVTDAVNRVALAGAAVTLEGTPHRTVTDAAGTYGFTALPPGRYLLRVEYLGLPATTAAIDLAAGATLSRDLALGSEIVTLEAFNVTGSAEGQAKALNQRRTSANLKNVIAADAIGSFPDVFAADALARVSGVSVDRDHGEGRNVTIRGLESTYNNVLIDGQRAPGGNRQDRRFELDMMPASLIESIEVSKAVTPDMDAASIGGTIHIKTPSAFARDGRTVSGSLRYGYNDLGGGRTHQGALSYSDRFGASRNVGVFFSATRQDTERVTDDQEGNWTLVPGTAAAPQYFLSRFELREYQITRRRQGYALNLDWKPAPHTSLFLRSNLAQFDEDELRPTAQLNLGTRTASDALGGATTGGDIRRLLSDIRKDKLNYTVSGGGETRLLAGTLNASVARSHGRDDMYQDDNWDFRQAGVNFAYDLRDKWFPRATVTNARSLTDPALFLFNNFRRRPSRAQEQETTFKADWRREFNVAARPVAFKTGGKLARLTRSNDQRTLQYNRVGAGFALTPFAIADHRPDFLESRYQFGTTVDSDRGVAYLAANPALATSTFAEDSIEDYTASERLSAAYAQVSVDFGRASLLGGVRYEATRTEFDAPQFSTLGAATRIGRLHSASDYDHLVPGLHLRWTPRDRLVVRAAWTNTLARPKFIDTSPAATVSETAFTIAAGNPDLSATESMNFDLAADYYFKSLGLLSVAAYHKRIDNFAYSFASDVVNPPGLAPGTYRLTSPRNSTGARLTGVEFDWQQRLGFLPGPLSGLGLAANLTLSTSSVTTAERPGVQLPFFRQPRRIANLSFTYKTRRLDARLSWVHRTAQLIRIAADPNMDLWSDPTFRCDFTATYKLSARLTLVGDALNLTNDNFTRYMAVEQRPIQNEQYGRTYSLGVRWSL